MKRLNQNQVLLIIGGDFRQLEVIRLLAPKLSKIYLIGFEDASIPFENVVKVNWQTTPFHEVDSILLPIPGIQDNGIAESAFSTKELILTKEIINKTKPNSTLYSGIITPFLKQLAAETNRNLVALFARNDVAILNSIPTAEGALMLAIKHTDITIHNAEVLVLGFGRVGKTVARLFSAVGAKVTVLVNKKEDEARVIEMGFAPIFETALESTIPYQHIVINTVPALILTSTLIKKMSSQALIIDLASKPGGTDFVAAKEHNIQTLWALGLPAKVAPRAAGSIIGETLLELLTTE
ncbi:dipicolinate synthase subunit DpsA [Niallia sp.]|uniref:dipicolinate synthase subunit DpsA n=1 Tax=Niallia sp. TaxID=2837523 RepID=UPI00289A1B5E|nr:dipicolinate synthase subunit DpsA [Niallia sp.]